MHAIDRVIRIEQRKIDKENQQKSIQSLTGKQKFICKAKQRVKLLSYVPHGADEALRNAECRRFVRDQLPHNVRQFITSEFLDPLEACKVMYAYHKS